MPLCEFEKTITCPYNPSHQITEPRMGFHLTKCRKNHADSAYVVCPFNSLHHIPKPEEKYHKTTCADRKSVELLKFMTDDEKPVVGASFPNVINNKTDIPDEENWEEETVTFTYDPSAKAASKPVLRKIEGATPSQRKEFRRKERERLGKLSQGTTQDSFDMDQTQSIPSLATSNQSSDNVLGSSQRRDSHLQPLRRPTIVQESVKAMVGIENQLLKVHLGRGMETPAQRMASRSGEIRRPGEVRGDLRSPGEDNVEFRRPGEEKGEFNSPGEVRGDQHGEANVGEFRRPNEWFRRPGEGRGDLRRPGEVTGELRHPVEDNMGEMRIPRVVPTRLAVGPSNASEDGGSSTTSYSVNNDVGTNNLLGIARGRGIKILKGTKKPGGLMPKGDKEE